ncbi:MAG: FeoA domain-containing protein [Firmicutes bacterium]|nr:FeoA domain-containing protein [Bacillota bacterium]
MSNTSTKKADKILSERTTLACAKIGADYAITDCLLPVDSALRFAELGLTCGVRVAVLKKAPTGDPIEISVRGYSLCLRKKEAEYFIVKEREL